MLDIAHMSRKVIEQGTEEIPVEYFYTEISARNVDKWTAIEFLMRKNRVENKKIVMAIGDNMNDKRNDRKCRTGNSDERQYTREICRDSQR